MPAILLLTESSLAHTVSFSVFKRINKMCNPPEIFQVSLQQDSDDLVRIQVAGENQASVVSLNQLEDLKFFNRSYEDPISVVCPVVIEDPSKFDEHISRIDLLLKTKSLNQTLEFTLCIIFPYDSPPTEEQRNKLDSEISLPGHSTIFLGTNRVKNEWPDTLLENTSAWLFGAIIAKLDGKRNTLQPTIRTSHISKGEGAEKKFAAYGAYEVVLFPAEKVAERWKFKAIYDHLKVLLESKNNKHEMTFKEFSLDADNTIRDRHDPGKIIPHYEIPLPDEAMPWTEINLDPWLKNYKSQCTAAINDVVSKWIKNIIESVNPIRNTTRNLVDNFSKSLLDFEVKLLNEMENVDLRGYLAELSRLNSANKDQNISDIGNLSWKPLTPVSSNELNDKLDNEINPYIEKLQSYMSKRLFSLITKIGILPILVGLILLAIPINKWLSFLPQSILQGLSYFSVALMAFGLVAGGLTIGYFIRRRKKILDEIWENISAVLNLFKKRYNDLAANLVLSGDIRRRRFLNQIINGRIKSWDMVIKQIMSPEDEELEPPGVKLSEFDQQGKMFFESVSVGFREKWRQFVKMLSTGQDPERSFKEIIIGSLEEEALTRIKKQDCLDASIAAKAIRNSAIDPSKDQINSDFFYDPTIGKETVMIVPTKLQQILERNPDFNKSAIIPSDRIYDRINFISYIPNLPITAFRFEDNQYV